jgi:hypothetical protein
MLRHSLYTIAVAAALAGCATKPVEVVDNTPLHTTAVIERQVVNNGIKGFFPTESTEQNYIRSNMRRDESMFKGTGTFSGYLIGKKSGTTISRIDRDLQWMLDTEKHEYTECPLKGCAETSKRAPPKQNDAQEQPKPRHESGCTMTVANTSFTVKSTGQKKTINGFDTDEYQVAWVVKLRDNAARTSTSIMNMDIWTTPMTRSIRDVLNMEESYARAYAGTLANSTRQQILPSDAAKLISAYMASSLKQADLKAFLDAGRQMEKIKGYPISTRLAWNMDGNACAPKETKSESSSREPIPSSASGLVSSLTGMFAKKKTDEAMKEAEGEPILSFTVEVKALKLDQLHDSIFTVPVDYKLVSRQ